MAKSPLDVRLYRSSVKGRRPQPADMAYGDLAINYNHEDPALIIKGDDNVLIEFKPGTGSGVTVSATAPTNPKDGDLWWDTTSARLFLRYTSGTPAVSTWVDASPAAVPPTLANALTYKGTIDPTVAASAPASPKVGDTYVASKAGAVAAGWAGLAGSSVSLHELLVWDGTEWDGAGTAATPRTAWQGTLSIEQPYPAGYTPVAGDIVKFSYHPTPGPYVIHADWKNAGVPDDVSDTYDTWIFDGTQWGAIGPEITPESIIQPCLTHGGPVDFTQPKPAGFTSKRWEVHENLGSGTLHSDYGGLIEVYNGDLLVDMAGSWIPLSSRLNEAIFRGVVDVAAAMSPTYRVGDSISVMRAGPVHASWVGITSPAVKGTIYFYDGGKWNAVGGGAATPATTTAAGTVQLADAAAITAGTAGRVVDAAQLKADKVWSRSGTTLSPATAGDLVAAAALPMATATALGGVKVGDNLQIDATGKLSANLASVLTYRGAADPTAAPPATPKAGDTYVASAAGTAAAGWTGLAGSSVSLHELLVWDGTEWDGAGTAATPRTAWQGTHSIMTGYPAGYTPAAGDVVKFTLNVDSSGNYLPYTVHADWAGVTDKVADFYDTWMFDGTQWFAFGPEYDYNILFDSVMLYKGTLDFTIAKPADFATGEGTANVYQSLTTGETHASWNGLSLNQRVRQGEYVVFCKTFFIHLNENPLQPTWRGEVDMTVANARPGQYTAGDMVVVKKDGATHADWSGIGANAKGGDIYIYDGFSWKKIGPNTGGSDWTRTGRTLAPATTGDVTEFSAGTAALPGQTPAGDANTGAWAPGPDSYAISTGGVERVRWDVNGETVASLKGPSMGNVMATKDGVLKRQAMPFTWDANDDGYTRVPSGEYDVSVQMKLRRCLLDDSGSPVYLDSDDSAKKSGPWLRLCQKGELSVPYTGTPGEYYQEVNNGHYMGNIPEWKAGTYHKGYVVRSDGYAWECMAPTTTAKPAGGGSASILDGSRGQVMVEVPLFSIRHEAFRTGYVSRHELSVTLGVCETGGYQVHPAFVKPDGSFRNYFYVGAYPCTGTNGDGSASGQYAAVHRTRAQARAAIGARGPGWHPMSYYQYIALSALLIAEYQDFSSKRCVGYGASVGGNFPFTTGVSNSRGNRIANNTTLNGGVGDYMSYRGVENFYGRAWQLVDGLNYCDGVLYATNDHTKFADDTSVNYQPIGSLPAVPIGLIRDVSAGAFLLPSDVVDADLHTHTQDAFWTKSGWNVAAMGGAPIGTTTAPLSTFPVGALCYQFTADSSYASYDTTTRIAYSPD